MSDQPIRVGWFPAQCVQLQSLTSPISSVASYQNTPGKCPKTTWTDPDGSFVFVEIYRYIAIFPYQAQLEDELSFPVDAILEVVDRTSNTDWFKARLGNQIGLVPSTYVQPVDDRRPCKFRSDLLSIRMRTNRVSLSDRRSFRDFFAMYVDSIGLV